MIYVVEIMGPSGERATKEYDATSIRDALREVEADLQDYPLCEIVDIFPVGSGDWKAAA
jgi:hypothetical protein